MSDPHVLHADRISEALGRLVIDGRRPTGHASTVIVDLGEMDDLELHRAANAFLHVLYDRFPREARLLDRTHEGAA